MLSLACFGYEVEQSHDRDIEWGCKCVGTVFCSAVCTDFFFAFLIFFCLNFLECMDLMSSCGQDRWQMLWLI